MDNEDSLINTSWLFRVSNGYIWGVITFSKNGIILGYNNPNETFWKFDDNGLSLLSSEQIVTTSFGFAEFNEAGKKCFRAKNNHHYIELLDNSNEFLTSNLVSHLTWQLRDIRYQLDVIKQEYHQNLHNILQTINTTSINAHSSLNKNEKIKVFFLIHNFEAWDCLADVYDYMKNDTHFSPIIATIPRRYPMMDDFGNEEINHNGLKSLGIPHLRFNHIDSYEALDIIKSINPHIIFRQSPWDRDIGDGFNAINLRFAKLCYIAYGVLNIPNNNFIDIPSNKDVAIDSKFRQACWKYFCANDLVKKQQSIGILQDSNIIVTGHPKPARLLRQGSKNPKWTIHSDNNEKKYRVIWSPHHSIEDNWNNFGGFHLYANEMLSLAKESPQIEIVLSWHPALVNKLIKRTESPMNKEDFTLFMSEWNSLPNTAVFEGGNYASILAEADLLITDGLSMLIEFQLFLKPILFYERPDHIPFSEAGEIVIKGVHRCSDFSQIKTLLFEFKNGKQDEMVSYQKEFKDWIVNENAAKNICEYIKSEFGISSF